MSLDDLLRLTKEYGFAALVAIVLLWVLLFRSPDALASRVDAQGVVITQINTKLDDHAKMLVQSIDAVRSFNERMLRLNYLMCLNTARTQAGRDACDAVVK